MVMNLCRGSGGVGVIYRVLLSIVFVGKESHENFHPDCLTVCDTVAEKHYCDTENVPHDASVRYIADL